ncbi:hypothetical protein CR513_36352, partial [Mucuna pruriens]
MRQRSKDNVVVVTLSRKSLDITALMVRKLDKIKQFKDLSLVCEVNPKSVCSGMLQITSSLLDEIQGLIKLRDSKVGCVLSVLNLRKLFIEEGHRSNLSVHPDRAFLEKANDIVF